jgi:heme exporter protein D
VSWLSDELLPLNPCRRNFWSSPLLIPADLALLSLAVFLVQSIYEQVTRHRRQGQTEAADASREERDDTATYFGGLKTEIAHHVKKRGGFAIFVWKLLRLLTCLALVAVTIAVIVIEKEADSATNQPANDGFVDAMKKWGRKKKHRRKHRGDRGALFTIDEWYQISLCLVFVSFSGLQSRHLPHRHEI